MAIFVDPGKLVLLFVFLHSLNCNRNSKPLGDRTQGRPKIYQTQPKEKYGLCGSKIDFGFSYNLPLPNIFSGPFHLGGKYIGGFSTIDFSIYFYYIGLSILLALPIIGIFGALSIRIRSFGIIVLLSTIFTMFGFASAFRSLKIVGLSFLAIEANNLRFINPHDLVLLSAFALGELFTFLYLSNKFLKFENKQL